MYDFAIALINSCLEFIFSIMVEHLECNYTVASKEMGS